MVATTAVPRTVFDEDNHVCGVQAVHTENRRWDQPDDGNGYIEGMIQRYCNEARKYVSVFVDATDVENIKTWNVGVDVGNVRIDVA